MKPEDILNLINAKVEEIKSSLPDNGRRLELQCFILTKEQWNVLLTIEEFKNEAERGNANLGGIPIKCDSNLKELEIKYVQGAKQRKYFRLRRSRKHEFQEEMES